MKTTAVKNNCLLIAATVSWLALHGVAPAVTDGDITHDFQAATLTLGADLDMHGNDIFFGSWGTDITHFGLQISYLDSDTATSLVQFTTNRTDTAFPAYGYNSTALGSSWAYGFGSTAMGYYSSAYSDYATAMGSSYAGGPYATAMGNSSANGYGSTAMGYYSTANGWASTALGSSYAVGSYSTALGSSAAYSNNSTAMGSSSASGEFSTAIGWNSNSTGWASTAMGYYSIANGWASIALGSSYSNGNNSTAMGSSQAFGDYSTAMGASYAYGYNSTAIGNSSANGNSSTAMGQMTVAQSLGHFVTGQYNIVQQDGNPNSWVPTDKLFTIGNGNYDQNLGQVIRSNALVLLKNGRLTLPGPVLDPNNPPTGITLDPGDGNPGTASIQIDGQILLTTGNAGQFYLTPSAADSTYVRNDSSSYLTPWQADYTYSQVSGY